MPTVIANAFRLLLMVAFCLGSMPVLADASCDGRAAASACGCCPVGEAGCCSVSEKEAPVMPMHKNQSQQQVRDALSPFAPVVVILPSADALAFSFPQPVVSAAKAGHSRQSVLCVRTV